MRRRTLWLVVALIAGCSTAPYTKRSQLILVGPSEEMKLGTQEVKRVGRRLVMVAESGGCASTFEFLSSGGTREQQEAHAFHEAPSRVGDERLRLTAK